MAELQFPNIAGNFLSAYNQSRDQAKADKFAGLAAQALNDPRQRDALLSQAVAIDPTAGFQLSKQLESDTDRRQTQLYNMARGFKQVYGQNPQAAAGFYAQQLVPGLKRLGFDVPEQYDEQSVLPVVDQVLASFDPTLAKGLPTDVRSKQLIAQEAGIQPGTPDYQKVFRIEAGLDPRAVTGAPKQIVVEGADGRKRQGYFDPGTQQTFVFDETVNGFRPLGGGERVSVTATAPLQATTAPAGVGTISLEGLTPDQNQAVATLFAGLPQGTTDAIVDAINKRPRGVTDSGAPVALPASLPVAAPAPAVPAIAQTPSAAPASLGVGRSPEAEAAAVEAAKNEQALKLYDEQTNRVYNREAQQAAGKAAGEQQAAAKIALPKALQSADSAVSAIDKALSHPGLETATGLSSVLDPRNRIKGTDAYNFGVLLDQIKGKTFLQAYNDLRGSGAITENEGKAATAAIARLDNAQSKPEFEAALRELRNVIITGKKSAIQKAAGPVQSNPDDEALINKYLRP